MCRYSLHKLPFSAREIQRPNPAAGGLPLLPEHLKLCAGWVSGRIAKITFRGP